MIYVNSSNVYVLELRVDLSSGKVSGFKVVNVMKGYDTFLVNKGVSEKGEYRIVVDFINSDTWEHTIMLYEAGTEGLKVVFSRAITKHFYRAYVIYNDGLLLLLIQNEGIITINDLHGHEAQALKLTGRFYARLAKVPNPAWPSTYVLIIGSPSSRTKAYFFLINPPPGAATVTTATTSTSTTTPSKPQGLVLSKGDWLKYHVKVHGEGSLGTMDFETDVKVTVTSVSNEYVKLLVKPLKSLTYEQRSLITMGALTGNKLILALAANQPTTITYELPLQHPSKACTILATPTGKEETIKDSGTTMGHKYSVTCTYTPKGVLSTYTFNDIYSAGDKEVKVVITFTLVDSSKDIGVTTQRQVGGISNILKGGTLTVIAVGTIIAAVIVIVIIVITTRRK